MPRPRDATDPGPPSPFMSYKLFIPGPIAVSEKTLRAMARPMIGHRSTDFVALYQSIQPDLQSLMGTKDPVYLSTSSAWGVMEGAIRNVVRKKVLNCMNGAFSDKWYDVALRDGKQATALRFDWGKPVDPEAVRRELATGGCDALTLIHNETSCGCMSDLAAIMKVVREFPEVISIVDTVSSFSAMPLANSPSAPPTSRCTRSAWPSRSAWRVARACACRGTVRTRRCRASTWPRATHADTIGPAGRASSAPCRPTGCSTCRPIHAPASSRAS